MTRNLQRLLLNDVESFLNFLILFEVQLHVGGFIVPTRLSSIADENRIKTA